MARWPGISRKTLRFSQLGVMQSGIVHISSNPVIFCVTMWILSCTALQKSDYPCPGGCDCFIFPERPDAVHTRCAVDIFNPTKYNFSRIPTNNTVGLYFQCDILALNRHRSLFTNFMLSHLTQLEILELHDCEVTAIPRFAFYGLNSLDKLRFARTRHLSFEKGVFDEIPYLKKLEVTGGQSVFLSPGSLCHLLHLFNVNFTGSRIRDLLEVGLSCFRSLPNLRHMDFTKNFLTQLPADFSTKFPNMQEIYLQDNRISEIQSRTFKNMENLKFISLSNNFLATLPDTFLSNCTNVEGIGVSTNELSRIPKGLLHQLPKLRIFEARHTFLGNSVWKELVGVSTLEILDLSYTLLTYINSSVMVDLTNLKRVTLSGNSIRELSPKVFLHQENLELLYLRDNEIQEIGRNSLVGLRNLQALTLHDNNISEIHNAAFRQMQNSLSIFLNLSSNSLTEVPVAVQVLKNVVSLDLSRNQIQSLSTSSFDGLDSLMRLTMSGNKLQYIPQNVFQKCPKIAILDLGSNWIHTIQNNAFGGIQNLRYIWLEDNQISDINWVFTNMVNLNFLNLSNNQIDHSITPYIFPNTLQYLYLAQNRIFRLLDGSFENMLHLKLLDLRGNLLAFFSSLSLRVPLSNFPKPYVLLRGNPLHCSCNMAWLKFLLHGNRSETSYYFKVADYGSLLCHEPAPLRYKFVDSIPRSAFVCYYKVNCLYRDCPCCHFDACDCKSVCPENCTCYHDQTWSIHMVDCQSSGWSNLPTFLPRSVTELRLDGNNLRNLDKHSFLARHNLTAIYLNNSQIHDLDNKTFHGLPSLKVLYLSNNNIESLSPGVFSGLSLLEKLFLDDNMLSHISKGVFDDLHSLKLLALTNNKLSVLPVKALPMFPPGKELQLYLRHNPFTCSCDQVDEAQTFVNMYGQFIKDIGDISCVVTGDALVRNVSNPSEIVDNISDIWDEQRQESSPGEKLLNVVSNVYDFCPNDTHNSTITVVTINKVTTIFDQAHLKALIIVSVVAVVLAAIFVLLYARRKLIMVWIYSRFGLRFCRQDQNFDRDKKYDAFVSYSSRDEHFVVHELAPRLEQSNPSYKLCLHYRDFPVGASIAETIIESVEASRRTILVLSDNFLLSEWCRFEFQSAHHQVLKDRLNRLIVILISEVSPEKLDPDMKLYLKTKTYLKVDDPWFWEKLKYALPDKKVFSSGKQKSKKGKKKKSGENSIGPSVYVVFGSNSSLHIYEEVQPGYV